MPTSQACRSRTRLLGSFSRKLELLMNQDLYFRDVLEQNRLVETVDYLRNSSDLVYYADRHVEDLPFPDWLPTVACEAGLALLRAWHEDSLALAEQGFAFAGPVLVVDESWLQGLENPPPPHVLLYIAKMGATFEGRPDASKRSQSVTLADCPFGDLVLKYIGDTEVAYAAPNPEEELDGYWLIPPVRSIYRDGLFLPIHSVA